VFDERPDLFCLVLQGVQLLGHEGLEPGQEVHGTSVVDLVKDVVESVDVLIELGVVVVFAGSGAEVLVENVSARLCNESLEICVEWFAGALVGTFDCLDHKPHLLLTNFIKSLPVERLGMWECVGLQNLTPLGLDAGVVAECKGVLFVASEQCFVESLEVWSGVKVLVLLAEDLPNALEVVDNQAGFSSESDREHFAVDLGEGGESLVRHLVAVHLV